MSSGLCVIQTSDLQHPILDTSANNQNLQNTTPLVERPANGRELDIDLNHTPPPSPPTLQSQSQKPSQESKRRGRKPKYTAEERLQRSKERLYNKARKYNQASVMKAKSTMKGAELEEYLQKAHESRIRKRIRDARAREKVSQRFLNGTQTLQDEKSRKSGIQRAIRFRERKRNNKTNS